MGHAPLAKLLSSAGFHELDCKKFGNKSGVSAALVRGKAVPRRMGVCILEEQYVGQPAFIALGGIVEDFALEPHLRRAAAVQIHGGLRAEALHQVLHLGQRHAAGRVAAPVGHDDHIVQLSDLADGRAGRGAGGWWRSRRTPD